MGAFIDAVPSATSPEPNDALWDSAKVFGVLGCAFGSFPLICAVPDATKRPAVTLTLADGGAAAFVAAGRPPAGAEPLIETTTDVTANKQAAMHQVRR